MKLSIVLLCFFNVAGHSQTVSDIEGEVKVRLARNGIISKADNNEALGNGDTVMSGPAGKCKIVLKGGDEIDLEPSSQFQIEDVSDEPASNKRHALFNLLQGQIHAKVIQKYDGDRQLFHVASPAAVVGVRGTEFIFSYDPAQKTSQVTTLKGEVQFGLPGSKNSIVKGRPVRAGYQSSAKHGEAPGKPERARVERAGNKSKVHRNTAKPAHERERKKKGRRD